MNKIESLDLGSGGVRTPEVQRARAEPPEMRHRAVSFRAAGIVPRTGADLTILGVAEPRRSIDRRAMRLGQRARIDASTGERAAPLRAARCGVAGEHRGAARVCLGCSALG